MPNTLVKNRCCWPAMAAIVLAAGGCAVKPVPINADVAAVTARDKLAETIAGEEPVKGPVSLYEAMARALKYNLDQRIQLMDEALRVDQLELQRFEMMPSLVASSGFTTRSNDAASRSKSIATGNQSLEPSTSSERNLRNAELAASWDVLDFGLARVRAKQAATETLIALERRRKVTNRILEDVRTAYWRAVSADRTFKKLVSLQVLAQQALRESEALEARRLVPPLTILAYQRDLISVQGEVLKLQRELSLSKNQLAALINLPPNSEFQLVLPSRTDVVPELPGAADDMVLTGLRFRPEVHEASYRREINRLELQTAYLRTLPSLKGILGLNFDSNTYLSNSQWLSASARISWNLLEVFRYPARKRVVETEARLLEQRDLALTMAVATQVHVARLRFQLLAQELNTIRRSYVVQDRILELSRSGFKARSVSQQSLVREEMNAVLAEVRYDSAYADLQNAFANLYASMGLDNFDIDNTAAMPVAKFAEALETHWNDRALTLPPLDDDKP